MAMETDQAFAKAGDGPRLLSYFRMTVIRDFVDMWLKDIEANDAHTFSVAMMVPELLEHIDALAADNKDAAS